MSRNQALQALTPPSAPATFGSPRLADGPRFPRFAASGRFEAVLRARVHEHFARSGRRRRDAAAMYLKTALILLWFGVNYLLLLTASSWVTAVPLSLSLGLAIAAVGFNIQHDGGHGAYSDRRWINRLAAMTLDVMGGSSYLWARKHNGLHHTYTNLSGSDDDINLGLLGRLAPDQPHRPWHRWQHLYLWPLYGLLPIKWAVYDDFSDVLMRRMGRYALPPLRPRDWLVFLGGKLAFFGLAFALPLSLHAPAQVFGCYFLASLLEGVVLSVVFQLAHCVEGAEFPAPAAVGAPIATPWLSHQLATTVDFSRSNPLLGWLLGGLNYQVEHHLFPQISHVHYAALSPIVERTCREFGVPFRDHGSLLNGVVAHYRWLRRMGRPPVVPG